MIKDQRITCFLLVLKQEMRKKLRKKKKDLNLIATVFVMHDFIFIILTK
ncbi:MAG: hypothetical protein ACFFBT_10105 [Promethearchaeota archaeon]